MQQFQFTSIMKPMTIGFRRNGSPNAVWIGTVLLFGILQAAFLVAATYFDGSWYLTSDGKGLFQHYGAIALVIADPLLIISTSYAYRQFRIATSTLPLCTDITAMSQIRHIKRPFLRFIHMYGRARYIYILCIIIGILSWVNNIYETNNPSKYFGHNVFDSTDFSYGFIVFKWVLFNSWVLIYPLCGFLLVSMCVFTRIILERLESLRLICPTALHPDGCYGLSGLGYLNICLLFPYILIFSVISALAITHEKAYASLIVPLCILSCLFLFVSVAIIKPVIRHTKSIDQKTYKMLATWSQLTNPTSQEQSTLIVTRLCFSLSNRSPYSTSGKIIVISMRFIPFAITIIKFLLK